MLNGGWPLVDDGSLGTELGLICEVRLPETSINKTHLLQDENQVKCKHYSC